MNTRILKIANINTLYCIYVDFGLDAKDFEMLKNRHEDDFNGLNFRDAKKQIIKDVFTDKKQIEKYLNNYKHDYFSELQKNYLGKEFLKELQDVIKFLEKIIYKM